MKNEIDVARVDEHVPSVEVSEKYLRALRKAIGLQIDPATAEVEWIDLCADARPLWRFPKPSRGIPASWAGILRPFSRK
jgi:hypothetical protein